MKALSGETKKLDELLPTLPPGPDGKAPDPRDALTPPAKLASAVFHPPSRAEDRAVGSARRRPYRSRDYTSWFRASPVTR